jgi:hypothetical protein
MTIKFVCSCGKRLRARDDLAARRLACPRCGKPVGIPSSNQPRHTPLINPLAPPSRPHRQEAESNSPGWEPNEAAAQAAAGLADRLRLMGDDGFVELTAASARPKAAAPLAYRPAMFRQSRDPGTRWYHCLLFPRAAVTRIIVLGCLLGLLAVGVPAEARVLLTSDGTQSPGDRLGYGAGLVVATLVLVSQISAWFVCVLAAEKAGQLSIADLSIRQIGLALRSLAVVICTFLGGPIVLAGLCLWFWIHTGRMLLVDWMILGELSFVLAGYWLFALAEVCLSRWPRPANPMGVARLIHQLGPRSLVAAGLAWGFALLFMAFLKRALQPVDGQLGLLTILSYAVLCILWGSIVLRMTGMWCRLSALKEPELSAQASNSTPGSPALTSPIR